MSVSGSLCAYLCYSGELSFFELHPTHVCTNALYSPCTVLSYVEPRAPTIYQVAHMTLSRCLNCSAIVARIPDTAGDTAVIEACQIAVSPAVWDWRGCLEQRVQDLFTIWTAISGPRLTVLHFWSKLPTAIRLLYKKICVRKPYSTNVGTISSLAVCSDWQLPIEV